MATTRTSTHRPRSARWLVPVGTAGVVAVAVLATQAGPADAEPVLPGRTAAQLLAAVGSAQVDGLSGTVETSSDLGLPSLGAVTGDSGSGPTSLTSGDHELRVWSAGADRSRVTINEQLSEYSVVRRDRTVYAYDSAKNTVALRTLPASDEQKSMLTATTPQEAAEAALAAVGPTTAVTVDRTARVAGRSAYQLVLTPRDARSLVGSVRVAVDSRTSLPLRVQVFARGAADPALQVGFTTLDLSVPDASVFAVPEGKQVEAPQPDAGADAETPSVPRPTDVTTTGTSWTAVVSATGVTVPAAAAPLLASASTGVTVSGVSGRLVRTALVSALVLDDGRAYAGAVTPETLTAAAAK